MKLPSRPAPELHGLGVFFEQRRVLERIRSVTVIRKRKKKDDQFLREQLMFLLKRLTICEILKNTKLLTYLLEAK